MLFPYTTLFRSFHQALRNVRADASATARNRRRNRESAGPLIHITCADVIAVTHRADGDRVILEGEGKSELSLGHAVAGDQVLHQLPLLVRSAFIYIGTTLPGVEVYRCKCSGNDRPLPFQRNLRAKLPVSVRSANLLGLHPFTKSRVVIVYIGGARCRGQTVGLCESCAHQNRVALKRNTLAKIGTHTGVRIKIIRHQLLAWLPLTIDALEYPHRTVCTEWPLTGCGRSNCNAFSVNRYAQAELSLIHTGVWREDMIQLPVTARISLIQIHLVAGMRSDCQCCVVQCQRNAKLVLKRRSRSHQGVCIFPAILPLFEQIHCARPPVAVNGTLRGANCRHATMHCDSRAEYIARLTIRCDQGLRKIPDAVFTFEHVNRTAPFITVNHGLMRPEHDGVVIQIDRPANLVARPLNRIKQLLLPPGGRNLMRVCCRGSMRWRIRLCGLSRSGCCTKYQRKKACAGKKLSGCEFHGLDSNRVIVFEYPQAPCAGQENLVTSLKHD